MGAGSSQVHLELLRTAGLAPEKGKGERQDGLWDKMPARVSCSLHHQCCVRYVSLCLRKVQEALEPRCLGYSNSNRLVKGILFLYGQDKGIFGQVET